MPSYFFDTSALVNRYHREPGTDWVRAVCDARTRPQIYISHITQVEMVASVRRLGRINGYHHSFTDAMVSRFRRDLNLSDFFHPNPIYTLVPVSPAILELATLLCDSYWQARPAPLRSLDAIQLACAVAIARTVSDTLTFVTADLRLASIAPLESLAVVNPMYASPP